MPEVRRSHTDDLRPETHSAGTWSSEDSSEDSGRLSPEGSFIVDTSCQFMLAVITDPEHRLGLARPEKTGDCRPASIRDRERTTARDSLPLCPKFAG